MASQQGWHSLRGELGSFLGCRPGRVTQGGPLSPTLLCLLLLPAGRLRWGGGEWLAIEVSGEGGGQMRGVAGESERNS